MFNNTTTSLSTQTPRTIADPDNTSFQLTTPIE